MATKHSFTTLRSEGAILPPDLLRRVQDGDKALPELAPESYHLPGGMRLGEATGRAWNALLGAWETFEEARAKLPEGDPGTTVTREKWLLPLFQELNYGRLQTQSYPDIEGKSYPISHGWGHAPIHLVGAGVKLDKRSAGVAGAARSSPHSLVQEYLNRSDDHLWGMVSNGLQLRLLRDNASLTRQAYVEFDLEAMMTGEVYADFVLLWLLLHQSRVESEKPQECALEQWSRLAAEEGTRALEHLRVGVEHAIRALGKGFLAAPANDVLRTALRSGELSAQDYYRQLLRLVYRLLFLFVAEDRELLHAPDASDEQKARYHFYSTRRLRELADTLRGSRHADLFEALKVMMNGLGSSDGTPTLGLPSLGGFLFSERATPDLNPAIIANAHLLQAVRGLAYVQDEVGRRPVDYKNLGSEELGSVYESLLELHPEIDTQAPTFSLTTAAGNERKTTGSYYTPSSLINLLLESALEPVLNDAVKGKTAQEAEAAILELKIVDPACGSGHFLIAAAQRLAKRLARVRTGDEEPAPEAVTSAVRDVIGRCIYGVDVNEMSAELCKVALWMEALEPGKPLTFLEHRIRVGNSLLGTTPELIKEGLPDDAFKPIEGDDKKTASGAKKHNRKERKGESGIFEHAPTDERETLTRDFAKLTALPDDSPAQIRAKEERLAELLQDERYAAAKLTADAWCAAFMWPKQPGEPPAITTGTMRRLQERSALDEARRQEVKRITTRYGFFHWHLAFPEVFGEQAGGFDVVLGNPPWERLKIQEKEWFAQRRPEIANARNASERGELIRALEENDPDLFEAFAEAKRQAEGESHYARNSNRYPLTGRGDVNTYPLFAELARNLQSARGRMGMILPSGIATDATTQYFFQDLVETKTLASLYDFENRNGIFPGVHRSYKFCLLTLSGEARPVTEAEFAFFALDPAEVRDSEKRFTLSPEDIALLNPNTKTCPVFRSSRDAEITKGIYRRVPVLLPANGPNSWPVDITRTFDMARFSRLAKTQLELEAEGFERQADCYGDGNRVLWTPIIESKMVHQFNHRYATYVHGLDSEYVEPTQLKQVFFFVNARFWLPSSEVARLTNWHKQHYWLAYRDIARATDERTTIAAIIPRRASDYTLRLMYGAAFDGESCRLVLAALNSFIFDYVARQAIAGTHFSDYIMQQLPVLPPTAYTPADLSFITPRVLELSYTAWDLQPFAQDLGYDGPPFVWDETRRFWLRAELDALYFHLYGISRDDVAYIMDTFPIVRRKDEAAHGCYRTKEAILEVYDELARCKAAGREYVGKLEVPLGAEQVAHPPEVSHEDAFEIFIEAYRPQYPELAEPARQQSLRSFRLRGSYPETPEEWLDLYLEVRDAMGEG